MRSALWGTPWLEGAAILFLSLAAARIWCIVGEGTWRRKRRLGRPTDSAAGTMISAAQLLDELMGRDRNLAPDEKRSNVRWDHESVSVAERGGHPLSFLSLGRVPQMDGM